MGVKTAAELLGKGYSYHEMPQIEWLEHIRRGAYRDGPVPADPTERYLELIRATYPQLPRGGVLSHVSAAVLHGLPVPWAQLRRVQVVRPGARSSFTSRYVTVRITALDPADVVGVDSFPVTSLPRTVADLIRTLSTPWAVAAGDAALRMGLSRNLLDSQIGDMARLGGRRQGMRVSDFLDPRAESPGESISRALMAEAGLPVPALQARFHTEGHDEFADFHWRRRGGVIGEFDGAGKYRLPPSDGTGDITRALFLEKQREDRLRQHVRSVVRWVWDDLAHPDRFLSQIAAALGVPFSPIGHRSHA